MDATRRSIFRGALAMAFVKVTVAGQNVGWASALQRKDRPEAVWIDDPPFNALGDGADETAKVAEFLNHAKAHAGVPHKMPVGVYGISSELPKIDVSNVWIEGAGCDVHDVGSVLSGTYFRWIGARRAGPMLKVGPVPGAKSQRLSNVKIAGFGLDCGGPAGVSQGIEIRSIRSSEIDIAAINASDVAVSLGVVDEIGEGADLQRNIMRLKLRQIESPDGTGLQLSGNEVANVSMNNLEVDGQHCNVPLIKLLNSDSNEWDFVRIFKVPAGKAKESISIFGGLSQSMSSRSEIFRFLSTNTPVHIYGREAFIFPSSEHQIFLDSENGTPMPMIGSDASAHVTKNMTDQPEDSWKSFTPKVSSKIGSIAVGAATLRYARRGKALSFAIMINIEDNGSGAGQVRVNVPFPNGGVGAVFIGEVRQPAFRAATAYLAASSDTLEICNFDGTYPVADGGEIYVSGTYEVN